ncbi:hypothetical protein OC709_02220 ['Planchonia careya' phytoplasma]|nr:hypothetical protein ['Planchonia careya' phytoplasma]MDO8030314.1 hypothetical protein ['Planchonia careya' phytoplasma]
MFGCKERNRLLYFIFFRYYHEDESNLNLKAVPFDYYNFCKKHLERDFFFCYRFFNNTEKMKGYPVLREFFQQNPDKTFLDLRQDVIENYFFKICNFFGFVFKESEVSYNFYRFIFDYMTPIFEFINFESQFQTKKLDIKSEPFNTLLLFYQSFGEFYAKGFEKRFKI